jgi:hypothetical protein
MKYLVVLLVACLIPSSMNPVSINQEVSANNGISQNQLVSRNALKIVNVKTEQLDKKIDLFNFEEGNALYSVSPLGLCKSISIPGSTRMVSVCGEIDYGKYYLQACGSVDGYSDCIKYGLDEKSYSCQTIVGHSWGIVSGSVDVCANNLSITRQKISGYLDFKLCGTVKYVGTTCKTFYSQPVDYNLDDNQSPDPSTPKSFVDPEEFVSKYWQAVNSADFELAWSMLSYSFKDKWHNNSFSNYEQGYEKMRLCSVGASDLATIQQDSSSAQVTAHMTYRTGSKCSQNEYNFNHFLVYDSYEDSWLIDQVKYIK